LRRNASPKAPFLLFFQAMNRVRLGLILLLPLFLAGCYGDQKKQLAACEAVAPHVGGGQPLRSIQACMDRNGYDFVGYANPDGETIVCDLPAVIQGRFTNTAALCFQPRGWLALQIYHWQVPDRGLIPKADPT
jgi:hypothetical protein